MRMIVAGGGTGGHLFPGLAVAEHLQFGQSDDVLFVGSAYGIESRVIPRTAFPFRALTVRGLRGRGLRGILQLAWQQPVAIWNAWRIVGEFGAQITLGVGGYASFPVVFAAWLRRIPSVLLEQNARPGLANRVLAHIARRVCTTFPGAEAYLPAEKVVLTGNPVRPFTQRAPSTTSGFTLLVFGGSQGARHLNEALRGAAPGLAARIAGLQIIHQTGADDLARTQQAYRDAGIDAEVLGFIDDMGAAYARADLVICRAGATTLAELTTLGKASILVPYPFAADDHQRANAEVLVAGGAAVMVLDRELTADGLATVVMELAADRARLQAMGAAARQLGRPDAAERVVAVCREVVGEVEVHG
jgi:UDP-N-acetylglucosamine--N-acetylmuramyl-(pentapeptide) pyrophosphoryl-undecaprenol N-acetylglucosamine transferase